MPQNISKQESEGHPTILQQNWMLPTDKHALGVFGQSGGIDPWPVNPSEDSAE
jgi:hypothetical protein